MGRSFVSRTRDVVGKAKNTETLMNWSPEEQKSLPPKYSCEVLVSDGSVDDVRSPNYPSDAYIVFYEIDGKKHLDLCRGKRVSIFDMYYDKFGAGVIKKIDFGCGKINPKSWGYKPAERKRRK